MNEPPLFLEAVHERRHRETLDPGCPICEAELNLAAQRHPAGNAIAAEAEARQHDQAVADEAVQAQDDRTWMTRRRNLFTTLATFMLTAAVVLAVTTHPPVNGGELAAVLLAVAGGGFAIAAWALNDRLGGDQ